MSDPDVISQNDLMHRLRRRGQSFSAINGIDRMSVEVADANVARDQTTFSNTDFPSDNQCRVVSKKASITDRQLRNITIAGTKNHRRLARQTHLTADLNASPPNDKWQLFHLETITHMGALTTK